MRNLFLILLCCCYNLCFPQNEIREDTAESKTGLVQHTLFLELGGNSIYIYNITYDCSFLLGQKHKIAVASGFQYIPVDDGFLLTKSFGTSMQVNYLYGIKHHLETGIGITFPFFLYYDGDGAFGYKGSHTWKTQSYFFIPIRIGYRYQKSGGGFFWKVAFVPLLWIEDEKLHCVPSGGVAIGYTFKNKKR